MYGMIESNMLAIECENQRKHVPPWCYISIRDVTDASVELEPGKTGGIAILDALNTAYPGLLLSDDIGEVDELGIRGGRLVSRFSPTMVDHFTNPRNSGRVEQADVYAFIGNPVCGDSDPVERADS